MVWLFLIIFAVIFMLILVRGFTPNPVGATVTGERLVVRESLRVRVLDSLIYGSILLLVLLASSRLLALSVNLLTLVMTVPMSGAALIALRSSCRSRGLVFDRRQDSVCAGETLIGTMSRLRDVELEPADEADGLRLVFEDPDGRERSYTIECSDPQNLKAMEAAIVRYRRSGS